MIEILEERAFPVATLYPLASSRSAGDTVRFGGKNVDILDVEAFDWSQVEIALFSAGAEVSAKWAPIAAEHGCIVIDNTSCFRYDEDIPLVIPEVNPDALADFRNRNIIANPNCSTIQMLVALKPPCTTRWASVASTWRPTNPSPAPARKGERAGGPDRPPAQRPSGGADPLSAADRLQPDPADRCLHRQRLHPGRDEDGVGDPEDPGDASIAVNPTCVRVPVFYGHAEAVHVELHQPLDAEQVKELLRNAPGVTLFDDEGDYPTPVRDATGQDDVMVGRVRQDISHPSGINMWIVADNVRRARRPTACRLPNCWYATTSEAGCRPRAGGNPALMWAPWPRDVTGNPLSGFGIPCDISGLGFFYTLVRVWGCFLVAAGREICRIAGLRPAPDLY